MPSFGHLAIMLKQLIKKTSLYYPLRNWMQKRRQETELLKWRNNGCPVPPPHLVKQKFIRQYARQYRLKIFVETGTYYGDMVEAMRDIFDRIYSIELSYEFYKAAKKRFRTKKHIELIYGDSGKEIEQIMKQICQPALFWLDGHYSNGATAKGENDTPIYEELRHIFNGEDQGHVILIDDARYFGTDPAYPTINELKKFIKSNRNNVKIDLQDDCLRIVTNA